MKALSGRDPGRTAPMAVVGVRDVAEPLVRRARELVSTDGGWGLTLLNGPLLVPVLFAAFFHPVSALAVGAMVVAVVVGVLVTHVHRRRP